MYAILLTIFTRATFALIMALFFENLQNFHVLRHNNLTHSKTFTITDIPNVLFPTFITLSSGCLNSSSSAY